MLDQTLFADQVRKRIANQFYVYAIFWIHLLLNLTPGPIRNIAFGRMLGKAGRHIFFDHNVYLKFPWLIEIGDDVSINRGVEFYPDYQSRSRITIGSHVYIAPNVRFHASGHDLEDLTRHVGAGISVGDHVWLGASAIILPGVSIGQGAVVAAGSVVTKDVEAYTLVGGAPARLIRHLSETKV